MEIRTTQYLPPRPAEVGRPGAPVLTRRRVVTGGDLLEAYSIARFVRDHPDHPRAREIREHGASPAARAEILSTAGYSARESMEYYRATHLSNLPFNRMSDREFSFFLRNTGLEEILDSLGDDREVLAEAAAFLGSDQMGARSIHEFIQRYRGLRVGRRAGVGVTAERTRAENWEGRRNYLDAMVRRVAEGHTLDLSEERFATQLELQLALSRKSFEANAVETIRSLRAEADQFDAGEPARLPLEARRFYARVYRAAADHFEEVYTTPVTGMRSAPFPYQREAVAFLRGRRGAILGDDAGLGKTYIATAAAISLGLRRVVWVTTSTNRNIVQAEILARANLTEADVAIIEGPSHCAELVAEMTPQGGSPARKNPRFLIVSYETLRDMDPAHRNFFTAGLNESGALVVDEAQLIDHQDSGRSQVVRGISAQYRWLLSATPYQSSIQRLWVLLNYIAPERFPNFETFRDTYTQTDEQLRDLKRVLREYMLRRVKTETIPYFEGTTREEFRQQLEHGGSRIPRLIEVSPAERGAYTIHPAQADAIRDMVDDFRTWAEAYNETELGREDPINLHSINPFQKMHYIHRALYRPETLGILPRRLDNPLWSHVHSLVQEKLAAGEKVILWCWNAEVVEELMNDYASQGAVMLSGAVRGSAARATAIRRFQTDPNVRVMVANYQTGGVGTTLTAAGTGIMVQMPDNFPMVLQIAARMQRAIGLENLDFAREAVRFYYMVGKFPARFAESLADPELRHAFELGTLAEQTYGRIQGGREIFEMAIGTGDPEERMRQFQTGLFESMLLNRDRRPGLGGAARATLQGLRRRTQQVVDAAEAILPLWRAAQTPQAADHVLQLVDLFRTHPEVGERMRDALSEAETVHPDDIELILSLFRIKNRYIRNQILMRLPDLISRAYRSRTTLAQAAAGAAPGRLSPMAFVAQTLIGSQMGGDLVRVTADEIAALGSPDASGGTREGEQQLLQEQFFSGLFGIQNQRPVEAYMLLHAAQLRALSLEQRVRAIYRLGLLARRGDGAAASVMEAPAETAEQMTAAIERGVAEGIARDSNHTVAEVQGMSQRNPAWQAVYDSLLSLLSAWRELPRSRIIAQAREVLDHIVAGDFHEWRYGRVRSAQGNAITYLSESPAFWRAFNTPLRRLITARTEPAQRIETLSRAYDAVLTAIEHANSEAEGTLVKNTFQEYRDSEPSSENRTRILSEARAEVERLNGEIAAAPGGTVESANRPLIALRNQYSRLVQWIEIDQAIEILIAGTSDGVSFEALTGLLSRKARAYRERGEDSVTDALATLRSVLRHHQVDEAMTSNVTIEDTDDPTWLIQAGRLHPRLINCLNPNGNPVFTQHILALLGSKNMRLILVRNAEGQVIAFAFLKVKRLENEEPVLFLENGLFAGNYDFHSEMIQFVHDKARQVAPYAPNEITPHVAGHATGRVQAGDVYVYGTGSYTDDEYVEPVFGLRRQDHVRHRARIYAR